MDLTSKEEYWWPETWRSSTRGAGLATAQVPCLWPSFTQDNYTQQQLSNEDKELFLKYFIGGKTNIVFKRYAQRLKQDQKLAMNTIRGSLLQSRNRIQRNEKIH